MLDCHAGSYAMRDQRKPWTHALCQLTFLVRRCQSLGCGIPDYRSRNMGTSAKLSDAERGATMGTYSSLDVPDLFATVCPQIVVTKACPTLFAIDLVITSTELKDKKPAIGTRIQNRTCATPEESNDSMSSPLFTSYWSFLPSSGQVAMPPISTPTSTATTSVYTPRRSIKLAPKQHVFHGHLQGDTQEQPTAVDLHG